MRTLKARIFGAGIDLGIDASPWCDVLSTDSVISSPWQAPDATFLKGPFPANGRFQNDDVLSVGSDLGGARDSASRLLEITFGGAPREKNGVN